MQWMEDKGQNELTGAHGAMDQWFYFKPAWLNHDVRHLKRIVQPTLNCHTNLNLIFFNVANLTLNFYAKFQCIVTWPFKCVVYKLTCSYILNSQSFGREIFLWTMIKRRRINEQDDMRKFSRPHKNWRSHLVQGTFRHLMFYMSIMQ